MPATTMQSAMQKTIALISALFTAPEHEGIEGDNVLWVRRAKNGSLTQYGISWMSAPQFGIYWLNTREARDARKVK